MAKQETFFYTGITILLRDMRSHSVHSRMQFRAGAFAHCYGTRQSDDRYFGILPAAAMMPTTTNRGTLGAAVGALFAAATLFFQLASPLEAAGDGKVKDLLAGDGENPRNAKLCKTTIPWIILRRFICFEIASTLIRDFFPRQSMSSKSSGFVSKSII